MLHALHLGMHLILTFLLKSYKLYPIYELAFLLKAGKPDKKNFSVIISDCPTEESEFLLNSSSFFDVLISIRPDNTIHMTGDKKRAFHGIPADHAGILSLFAKEDKYYWKWETKDLRIHN